MLIAAALAGATTPAQPQDPPAIPGSWTMIHFPDMQNYVSDAERTEILNNQMLWAKENRAARNIRFAVQVGDLVNDNGSQQWTRSRAAWDLLESEIPYALSTGNHDCGPGGSGETRQTGFILDSRYGPASPYAAQPTLQAVFKHPDDPPGNTQNAWHAFKAGGQDFLVLTCEWGPRDKVVEWMDAIVAAHPHHRAILVCHAYLASGSARYDWSTSTSSMNPHSFDLASDPDGTNDGQELWEKLVGKHENFFLVCCGHAGRGFRTVTGTHGNKVHEMLYNTQDLPDGGNGWVRLLEFLPDGRTVQARTYSTHLMDWADDSAGSHRFTLSEVSKTDSDQDGMPDHHELQNGWPIQSPTNALQDADGDGFSNLHEFIARTSPLDAASALTMESVSMPSAGSISLEWQSVPGVTYQIEQSDTPHTTTNWSPAGSTITAVAFMTQATRNHSGSRKFYRITVLPPAA